MDAPSSFSDSEEDLGLSIATDSPVPPDSTSSSTSTSSVSAANLGKDGSTRLQAPQRNSNARVSACEPAPDIPVATAKAGKRNTAAGVSSSAASSSTTTTGSSKNSSGSSFPTPFKCSGEFCGFVLLEHAHGAGRKELSAVAGGSRYASRYLAGSAAANGKALPASTAVQMLFSQDELVSLGDENLGTLLQSIHVAARGDTSADEGSKAPGAGTSESSELHVITYRSIALAKANREHLTAALQAQSRVERSYEHTSQGVSKKSFSHGAARRSSLFDSTASQEFREGSRLRVYGAMGDGVASYYRQVRVCDDCYAIYSLLDMARKLQQQRVSEIAGGGDKHTRSRSRVDKAQLKLREEWEQHVERELEDKEKLYLRKSKTKPAKKIGSSGSDSLMKRTESSVSITEELMSLDDLDLAKLEQEPAQTSSSDRRQQDDGSLPVLLSPKGLPYGRKELSGESVAQQSTLSSSGASSHSTSMPVLPSSGSTPLSSSGSKTSVFKNAAASTGESSRQLLRGTETSKGLNKYLRGETKQIEEPTLVEGQLFKALSSAGASSNYSKIVSSPQRTARAKTPNSFAAAGVATVLLVDSDAKCLETLHRALSAIPSLSLDIESVVNAHEALHVAKTFPYDLILCERDLNPASTSNGAATALSGLEFTKLLRQSELQKSISASAQRTKTLPKRTTVICITSKTSRDDLQLYRDAGMDGCVGKPIHQDSLQHTVQAALAKFTSSSPAMNPGASDPSAAVSNATGALAQAKLDQQERKRHRRRRIEASSALPFPGIADMDAREDYVAGTFQMDAETAMPYCVLGNPALQPQHVANTFFNLVVIHDIFDTWERLQILLNPIIARYHGAIQVLVWNYPGQAYTSWRPGTLLNNDYHVQCFHALLQHLGSQGLKLWRDTPYYLMGIGNGGNIATRFCSHSPPLDVNTRALLLVNAFAFVDAQLAQFFHDCLKVFTCTPESRPDLPVYFHTRFLFSSAYLARVSTPLALNLYTAVMNPISLEGRKGLCQGALAHADVRGQSSEIATRLRIPVLNVCSSQNALVQAGTQAQKLLELCGLEAVDSIGKVLRQHRSGSGKRVKSSCIIWLPSGHEIFQECKQDMMLLVEQLVTGYHEANNLALLAPPPGKSTNGSREEDEARIQQHSATTAASTAVAAKHNIQAAGSFEDSFIDNVLSTVKQVVVAAPQGTRPSSRGAADNNSNQLQSPEKARWSEFQHEKAQKSVMKASADDASKSLKTNTSKQTSPSKIIAMTSWDPTTPAFERLSSNIIYKIGDGSKIYPDASAATTTSGGTSSSNGKAAKAAVPELKEYMAWRVKRNQKRLQRMEKQARVIQRAFRAFYARTLVIRIKRERCAVALQRLWRAKLARKKYKGMKKEDWAVRLLQRNWRGKLGRDSYRDRVRKYLAAIDIQRIIRGYLALLFVTRVRHKLHTSAVAIQRLVRQYLAKKRMFHQRRRRNGATTIQRVFRGHVGRKRFAHEKDKFLYSKTQSQGIAFGKQMLLEYKLYGTKLQSEVALLAKAKEDVEAQAEVLVNEICEFDEGIRLLESEMHALSQIETESMAKNLDEQGKWQLREQKMRLDREFTQMLAQIALRKEKLSVLEEKLQSLDKERLAKEEELKSLERKLVVLLEEQQQELTKIKLKQQTHNQLVLDLAAPSGSSSSGMGTPGLQMGSPWSGQSPHGGPRSVMSGSLHTPSAVTNAASAFTQQQREEANSLMESTETMMKFGFMSMSMTYFSSMNMVRAMRKIGAHHLTLDSAAAVSNKQWPEYATASGANPGSPFVPGSAAAGSPFGFSDGSSSSFQPAIPPGSFPGQQPLQVAGWSVADVNRWLDTLALGQYKRAFADAAVDGALLLHLNDDDLKNTLGMEHRLHRKKVLTSVEQLREAERVKMKKLYGANGGPDALPSGGNTTSSSSTLGTPQRQQSSGFGGAASPSPIAQTQTGSSFSSPSTSAENASEDVSVSAVAGANLKVVVGFGEFCTLVRHGKLKQLKEALAQVPDRRFDPLTVVQAFRPGVGTVYDDLLEKSVFHVNKSDENGNSPLLLAAQNNTLKVAQLLLAKGANPNHQNKNGNTAGHYAMAYSFFDLGAWLLDPEKGGGRDDLLNDNGLTAYDGLS